MMDRLFEQRRLMEQKGYRFAGQGYLHNVYEKDQLIYKCLKNSYAGDAVRKFEHEKAALDILRSKNIPTVNVVGIVPEGEILDGSCFLVETKAEGVNYSKDTMPPELKNKFFGYLMEIAQIEMPFFGNTKPGKAEDKLTWKEFLKRHFIETQEISDSGLKARLSEELLPGIERLPVVERAGFLVMDANPENFFWNEQLEVSSVIDIDHPICGDPFFMVAVISYEWGEMAGAFVHDHVDEQNRERYRLYMDLLGLYDVLLSSRFEITD